MDSCVPADEAVAPAAKLLRTSGNSGGQEVKRVLRHRRGMTTIELMIVVTIMGILAALVYPHFDHVTQNADDNVHRQQIRMIRMAIQLYQIQHGGNLPNLIASWDDLTKASTYQGHTCGPYLQAVPKNHKWSTVLDGYKVDPPTPYGYCYDYHGGSGTGDIRQTNGSGKKLYKW